MATTNIPVWAETNVTNEGISTTLYTVSKTGREVVVDESWQAWADVVDDQDSWTAFQDVDIDLTRFTVEQ